MMHGGRNDGEASLVAGLLAVMATTDTDKASAATSAAATPRPVARVLDPAEYTTKQDGIYRTVGSPSSAGHPPSTLTRLRAVHLRRLRRARQWRSPHRVLGEEGRQGRTLVLLAQNEVLHAPLACAAARSCPAHPHVALYQRDERGQARHARPSHARKLVPEAPPSLCV